MLSVSVKGGGDGVLVTGGGRPVCFIAIMLCALIRAFFCSSRAIFVLSATALPAATCFGFFFLWRAFVKSLVESYQNQPWCILTE